MAERARGRTFLNPVPYPKDKTYRGRIAPTPTGRLHSGHAATFWKAQERARDRGGQLLLRIEDIDKARCKPEFVAGCIEDLKWFGFSWDEGPDLPNSLHAPYYQSQRIPHYREALDRLISIGAAYRCHCSRKDIEQAVRAPHAADDEIIYPGTCRPPHRTKTSPPAKQQYCWRFKVPDGVRVGFEDGRKGPCDFVSGTDFGDFVLWRADEVPSYQLAVVVDDHMMRITEVVRGEDLLVSTARQLLLYDALQWEAPAFFHCPLMMDEQGNRLAKRHQSLSLQALREAGQTPESIRKEWPGT